MPILKVDSILDKKEPVNFGARILTREYKGAIAKYSRWYKPHCILLYSSRPMRNFNDFLDIKKELLWAVPNDDVIHVSWGGYTKGRKENSRVANHWMDESKKRGARVGKYGFGLADVIGLQWLITKTTVTVCKALGIITYRYFLRIGIGEPKMTMRGEEFSVPLFELDKDHGKSFSLGQVLKQLKSHELYDIAMFLGELNKHETWEQLEEAYK